MCDEPFHSGVVVNAMLVKQKEVIIHDVGMLFLTPSCIVHSLVLIYQTWIEYNFDAGSMHISAVILIFTLDC